MKKSLWILLIIFLILSLPGIFERMKVEWKNDSYEFMIPYEEIKLLARASTMELPDILERLKIAGLQSVSLEIETLNNIEDNGDIIIFTPEQIRGIGLLSHGVNLNQLKERHGIYIHILNDTSLTKKIADIFSDRKTEVLILNGEQLLFIPGKSEELMDTPIGFSNEIISMIHTADLSFVPRLPNLETSKEALLFDELLTLTMPNKPSHRILFSGDDILGYPNMQKIKSYGKQLRQENFAVYQIEMSNQHGFNTLAHSMGMQVIRLHSIDLSTIVHEEARDRAIRAVKERNIRSLFFRLGKGEPAKVLIQTEQLLNEIRGQMPAKFQLRTAEPFAMYTIPMWGVVSSLFSTIVFLMLAILTVFNQQWLALLAGIATACICLVYALFKIGLLLKGLALLVAIITPIFALLPLKETTTFQRILLFYGRAALISFIGITIITALLNGNQFLVKVDTFRGVKLLYIIPIILMVLYIFFGKIKTTLQQPIRYWQAALAVLLLGLVVYYISRTGNAGEVSQIEMTFRNWLEQIMYARPRTKEFLIGYPLFMLTLYVFPKQQLLGRLLLIPSVIGHLSLVNTFTHLHIPLYVSIIRSVLGLLLGLVCGLIVIFMYKMLSTIDKRSSILRWNP